MDDSAIMCDQIIESYAKLSPEDDYVETNFNEKKPTYKTQNFFILLAFLLFTMSFLIAVSIYCYLIKYHAKQKHLLPFNFTNIKLKEIIF